MTEVCLLEFDNEERNFTMLGSIDLPSIPTSGDKIVHNVDGIGYIYKVYDVHYSDGGVDVNLIKLSTITDYNSSRFPDISL